MFTVIKDFFKLVRWFHEVVAILPFIALFLTIDYYRHKNHLSEALSSFDFMILCICVQTLIAAGCVLNDIADRKIDKINKPKTHVVDNTISLKNSFLIFCVLSLISLILSICITLKMFDEWAYISSSVYILSVLYNLYFKRTPLVGNILIALLASFIPLVLLFFAKKTIAEINDERLDLLIYLYAAFPFLIIVPRELSLDISDIEGDKAGGCRTLPIIIGPRRSKIIVAAFLILIILLSVPIAFYYHHLLFSSIIIDILLVIYIYKLKNVETRIEYIRIGRFLWFIMILGLVTFAISTIW